MKIRMLITAGALVALFSSAVSAAEPTSVTVDIKPLSNSGEHGTAVLTQEAGGVKVVIALQGAPKDAQPTHIHVGTCGKINKAPEYPLKDTVDGKSTSIVPGIKLSDLMSDPHAINIHKSAMDLATYVACGDVK
jgi:Cu/Zn superoxide dismutase